MSNLKRIVFVLALVALALACSGCAFTSGLLAGKVAP